MKANLILIAMMLVSSSFALHLKAVTGCSQDFGDTCKDVKIENGELKATCNANNMARRTSSLPLVKCLKLTAESTLVSNKSGDKSFNECGNCSLKSTPIKWTATVVVEITCKCRGKQTSFKLSKIISNSNGLLNCNNMCY